MHAIETILARLMPRLVTRKQAAAMLGVNESKISRLQGSKDFPDSFLIGGTVFFERTKIESFHLEPKIPYDKVWRKTTMKIMRMRADKKTFAFIASHLMIPKARAIWLYQKETSKIRRRKLRDEVRTRRKAMPE